MLIYEYGQGRVIATTAYTDWAYGRGQATKDGINLVRDIIAWAKDEKEIPEYAPTDTVNISVDVTNVHLPIPEVDYPRYELGSLVNIPVEIYNYSDQTVDKVVFSVFDPDYEEEYVEVSVSIPPNATDTVDFNYETTSSSKVGTYFVLYSLYSGETVIGRGFGGGFALGVDTSELSRYQVNFTLRNPDKNIVKEESISVTVPPGEIKEVNFTYPNPSSLGIWTLEYEILDYQNALIDSGTKKFAVSKYAENPEGFVYQGKNITFTISSPEERYAYGSDVPFTIHIWNKGDADRIISFNTYYKDWSLSPKLPEQNIEGTLNVPAGGEASFTHTLHVGDIYLSHDQLIIYASFSEDGKSLGRTEKVIWMFSPSIAVNLNTDKEEYAIGEDVSILLNLENRRTATYNVNTIVRVLDQENNKVFETSLDVTLPGEASEEKEFSFSLPTTARYGVYLVSAEAYVGGKKVGSGSTYFKVAKNYVIRVNFDHPDSSYKARENMRLELEAINVGSTAWSSVVNISIPDLNFSDSADFNLSTGQTKKKIYDLTIPEDITVGKHDVIVTVEFDNSTKKYQFFIPESRLVLTVDEKSYDAGEDVIINLSNMGGVDTISNCSVKFSDPNRFILYEKEGQYSILAGESKGLGFPIPNQAVSGDYYLEAQCTDQNTGKVALLSRSITISGVSASSKVSTDKEIYFADETIHASIHIKNLGKQIENGILDLKIYSGEYRVAPEATTESLDDRLKISNEFIEAAVDKYTGKFTVGTTGGDPEIESDDYVWLTYGHPNPWSSFTTVRINGKDYIYGSGGQFVSLPHFEGSSIVSDWKIEDVIVTQSLSIVYSDTGNPDALQIKYTIKNQSEMAKDIGIRVMIDTMLAHNDGAPFVIPGFGEATYEMEFDGSDVPKWWTTMDSLTEPAVIAHGTLRGVGSDPDKFVVAYWPKIYEGDYLHPELSFSCLECLEAHYPGYLEEYCHHYLLAECLWYLEMSCPECLEGCPECVEYLETGVYPEECLGCLESQYPEYLEEYRWWCLEILAENPGYLEEYLHYLEPFCPECLEGCPECLEYLQYPLEYSPLWDYSVDPNQPITSDSAIGIWWNPTSVPAGESKEIATFYGIGYVSEVGGEIVWEQEVPVEELAEGAEIDIPIDIVDLDATGRLTLVATLSSETSQTIVQDRTHLYIPVGDTYLTLETDKEVYKPGEEITINGEVTNGMDVPKDCFLSLKVNGEEIYSESFSLGPGQSHPFTTSTFQDSSFVLEGTVNGAIITDFIKIEYPSVNVTILAPDVVGLSPFDVGILIDNIGDVDAVLEVAMEDKIWDITVPAGESRLIETSTTITEDTTLSVSVSGDVEKVVQKEIIMGENIEIEITPLPTYLEGIVEIPYTIKNIGLLDSQFNATFSIDDQIISKNIFVPKGQSITDSVSFDLTKGTHLLQCLSPFGEVIVLINVLSPPECVVTSIQPREMNFNIGQDVTITFLVKNIGGMEGEATIRLLMPDFEEEKRTWIRPGEEKEISFNLTIPDDLEEKSYKGIYELNGKRGKFSFFVKGAKISVEAFLDKNLYEEGETAILTLEITNESEFDLNLYARVHLGEYEEIQHFDLINTETLQFNIPVSFNGQKIFYGIYLESGRALYLNSIYVQKKEEVITLYTDKQVYEAGEKVTILVDTAQSGNLNITAPGFDTSIFVSGSTALEFALPEGLRSGTYYIEYTFDDFSSSYPFDVIGYSARIIEFSLDKGSYLSGETMEIKANVEVNRDFTGLFRGQVYDPQGNLLDEFEIPRAFIQGENKIETNRVISTSKSGIHKIVYGVYAEISSLVLLASGAEYFDASAAVMLGDLDSDGDVDQNDLNILLTYRNQPASACPECDLDGDGVITVLDARKLVLLCTRPRCATE